MKRLLFTNVLFEKKRMLIAFVLILSILMAYAGIQMIFINKLAAQVATPDFQINGKISDDGVFYYYMYRDTEGLSDHVKTLAGDNMRVYGVTIRNLMTKNNFGHKIYYSVYGVDDAFFQNELKHSLQSGHFPTPGEKEAVIGSYAAKEYDLEIGDKIPVAVSLNKECGESDFMQYVVSGILSDDVDHFKGGIFISKETFEQLNSTKTIENQLLIYFENTQSVAAFEAISDDIIKLNSQYDFGAMSMYYQQKYHIKRNIIITLGSVMGVSFIILFLLISYLMKGLTKKIGLLKALGISDLSIIKSFVGGLGLTVVLSAILAGGIVHGISQLLNKSASDFLGYAVRQYPVGLTTYVALLVLGFLLFAMMYIIIKLKSSRILPRDAMLKN